MNKTVLIVPSWYESFKNPTRGSFVREQALAIKRIGFNVVVANINMLPLKDVFKVKNYKVLHKKDNGIDQYQMYIPSFGSHRRNTWFKRYSKFYKKLFVYISKRYKVDLIHAHTFAPAGFVCVENRAIFNCPIIYTEHFSGVQVGLNDYYKSALTYTMDGADKIIAVSKILKQKMIEYNNNSKISIVPNILGNDFTFEKREIEDEVIKIVSVGGLVPDKRHDLSIVAFHRAFPNKKALLTIVGQGKEKENLLRLIDDLGEKDRIVLVGQKERLEVANILKESSFFVLPSSHETFGVAYIEAMACGLPIIGTKCGGFEEIYYDSCGFIFDVDDLDGYIRALLKMSATFKTFDRAAIAKRAQELYGEKTFCESIQSIYKEFI